MTDRRFYHVRYKGATYVVMFQVYEIKPEVWKETWPHERIKAFTKGFKKKHAIEVIKQLPKEPLSEENIDSPLRYELMVADGARQLKRHIFHTVPSFGRVDVGHGKGLILRTYVQNAFTVTVFLGWE